VSDAVPQPWANSYAWGRWSALGVSVAALTCLVDQALKFWLLFEFDLANRGRFPVIPFFDLILTWNTGISYGLFPQQGPIGEWVLFAFKLAAVIVLWVWLARATWRLTAAALGLIIGGAIGNAIDRLHRPFPRRDGELRVSLVRVQLRRCGDCCGCAGAAV